MTSTNIDRTETASAPDPGMRAVLWFCAALIALVAGVSALTTHPGGGPLRWGVAALVFGFYAAGELSSVEIEFRNETHAFSFTSVPLVIGLLLLPIPVVVALRVLASLVVLGPIRKQQPIKLLVNLTSHALEVLLAGQIVVGIGVPASLGPRAWLAAGLAVAAADIVGALVVTTAISLFRQEWDRSLLAGVWFPLIVAVVDSSFALIVADYLRWGSLNVWLAVPVGAFMVALTNRFARVSTRYRGMARLDSFARDLGRDALVGDFEAILLGRVAEVMHAEYAWIWRLGDADPMKTILAPNGQLATRELSVFDMAVVGRLGTGAQLFGDSSTLGSELQQSDLVEAIVCLVDIAEGDRVVLGVGDRSGAVRGFDNEDLVLFDTLCCHAAVSLRNVALINELRAESASLEFQATHDPLTGLPNRTLFARHIERAKRDGAGFAVLLIDLDRFKEVNDTLGHASGDDLLIEVGRRLEPILGHDELLARLGGDEFVLAIRVADASEAVRRSRVILDVLRSPYLVAAVDVDVDASIGIAMFTDRAVDGDDLLRRADVAMYTAKANHSGVEVYSADLDHYSPKRLEVAARLRSAIDRGELTLHYQPQVDLATGNVVAVEALARWHDPEHGNIPPDEFIGVAERTDLIHPLTRHVLRTAIAQAARWQRSGRPLRVAVNISARNLTETGLVASIGHLLATEGLPATLLEIELTETTIMANPIAASAVIGELREMGIRIAIDDFGTGHSSLRYLTTLAVDQLKIDRSFIQSMSTDPTAETIVHAIVDLGRNLHLDIVAEGVETKASEATLQDMQCTFGQGYLFSRPIPEPEFTRWLTHYDTRARAPELTR